MTEQEILAGGTRVAHPVEKQVSVGLELALPDHGAKQEIDVHFP